jgi:bifunctional non-homologous end joining protein LigD
MKRPREHAIAGGSDAPGEPSRLFIAPCLATPASNPPVGPQWVYEIKYDGYRVQAHIASGKARLLTRSGLDWTEKLGRVRAELATLGARSAIIDGEAIVEDARGVPDFHALQREIKLGQAAHIVFMAFDILEFDGRDMRERLLPERKSALKQLLGTRPQDALLRFSDHLEGDGGKIFEHVCGLGLEGIVCKRIDRPYRSGRSGDWIKVKCVLVDTFVVGGYAPQKGGDEAVGSLALGFYQAQRLRYAGRVGTGFSVDEAQAIWQVLQTSRRKQPPFDDALDREQKEGVAWVAPHLVVEIAYRGWTHDNVLRHSVFRRFHHDIKPADVGPPASIPARD